MHRKTWTGEITPETSKESMKLQIPFKEPPAQIHFYKCLKMRGGLIKSSFLRLIQELPRLLNVTSLETKIKRFKLLFLRVKAFMSEGTMKRSLSNLKTLLLITLKSNLDTARHEKTSIKLIYLNLTGQLTENILSCLFYVSLLHLEKCNTNLLHG